MRIVHVASFYGTAAGGFIPMMAALARRLRARGDDVALVAPDVPGARWHAEARDAGFELHLMDGGAAAGRFARAWRADVVHVHFSGWEIALTLALWSSGARLIWHAHSLYRWDGPTGATVRSLIRYRLVGHRVERFITVSRAVAANLVRVGAPRRRIVTVSNAVDATRFRPPAPEERRLARAALGLTDRATVILFFGRHPRLKGADVLAAALANVPGTPVVVTVATPAEARASLAQHARVIPIERIDDVVPLMWAADVLAVPSRTEGFGLVLLEALLTGLPVAASDLPALREAAAGSTLVKFAPVDAPQAFHAALEDAVAGSDREAARAHLDDPLARWADTVAALYDDPEYASRGARPSKQHSACAAEAADLHPE